MLCSSTLDAASSRPVRNEPSQKPAGRNTHSSGGRERLFVKDLSDKFLQLFFWPCELPKQRTTEETTKLVWLTQNVNGRGGKWNIDSLHNTIPIEVTAAKREKQEPGPRPLLMCE